MSNVSCVYVISDSRRELFKIGFTNDPMARLSSLQSGSPLLLEFVAKYWVLGGSQNEKALHAEFASKRVRGEWFRLTPEDLNSIPSLLTLAPAPVREDVPPQPFDMHQRMEMTRWEGDRVMDALIDNPELSLGEIATIYRVPFKFVALFAEAIEFRKKCGLDPRTASPQQQGA